MAEPLPQTEHREAIAITAVIAHKMINLSNYKFLTGIISGVFNFTIFPIDKYCFWNCPVTITEEA